ncbi:hypothetical protein [Acinetobacter silvestris]|uniref:Uncharacterized protein n=1 Tax=Acinetobacter silvestris TaxID=1977882 RepID=A0A1Y3CHF7_9GAMM|nr:hypothetical protein [Acinetobacter silvestris]OTG65535.1 hypothetical protein B9T28_08740 [Acinetobacter silvestris]
MPNSLDGLHFPLDPHTNKISTSNVGKHIIAEALALVDHKISQQLLTEKSWRKNYPIYFKALVSHGIRTVNNPITIAKQGLHKAQHSFEFHRTGQRYLFKDVMTIPAIQQLQTVKITGESQAQPEWYVPYQGQKLQGQSLLDQIQKWQNSGIIEASHAQALREMNAHPEWFDLSNRTMVLFGAASEAGPLTWLSRWKANIIAIDLPNEKIWNKILTTIKSGNATLYAPSLEHVDADTPINQLKTKLGINLLTHIPEIAHWLAQNPNKLDLAAIAYLDGEKHVRVSMAMDSIMTYVSEQKPDSSLMYMCTPTDVYAVPEEVIAGSIQKFENRSTIEKVVSKGISIVSMKQFFKNNNQQLITSDNGKAYGIADCLVVEQGPNYALAKRIQQWRATLARHQGQHVSINIAPSTTTHSVTKNPLLKAAFNGAGLFNVEAFQPETTNAIMAALWVHDLHNPASVANPETPMQHPLELMMEGANHGGLWRVPYLARTALPFAAIYGFAADKLPINKALGKLKS